MNAYVDHMTMQGPDFGVAPAIPEMPALSQVETRPWGYTFGIDRAMDTARGLGPIAARFGGAILFLAGIGLWLMPDAIHGSEVYTMKMMAMIVFTLVGGVLVWSGRKKPGLEVQVDMGRRELRLGGRNIYNEFRLYDLLRFDEVRSIYLLRANGRVPARLYLRLNDGSTGIEVARGTQAEMEHLRARLFADLACRAPLG